MTLVMPEPSLDTIFDLVTGYQRTAALKTAIELDVFTAIGEGVDTVDALAKHCQAAPRGVRSLCDTLAAFGLLTKTEGRYGLGADAALFLDRHSPAFLGSIVGFIASPTVVEGFNRLTAAVRRGGTAIEEDGSLAPEHPMWVQFARDMGPIAAMTADLIANLVGADAGARWKVLDVAAGHGLYGIAIARRNPNAHVVALDWGNVLAVARENAAHAGVADRVRLLPGSAFTTDPGDGYDVVLLTNFLHHFDPPTCEKLLRKMHAALKPGGRAVALEFVPNDDRVTPPQAAAFSLVMLATTPHGDAYTFAELEQMFRNAGFGRTERHDLPPSPQRVVVAHRD